MSGVFRMSIEQTSSFILPSTECQQRPARPSLDDYGLFSARTAFIFLTAMPGSIQDKSSAPSLRGSISSTPARLPSKRLSSKNDPLNRPPSGPVSLPPREIVAMVSSPTRRTESFQLFSETSHDPIISGPASPTNPQEQNADAL